MEVLIDLNKNVCIKNKIKNSTAKTSYWLKDKELFSHNKNLF